MVCARLKCERFITYRVKSIKVSFLFGVLSIELTVLFGVMFLRLLSDLIECDSMCLFRLQRWIKDLLHSSHLNDLSLVCILKCRFRVGRCENCLLHILHLNGFSPVCMRMCCVRRLWYKKVLLQYWHGSLIIELDVFDLLARSALKVHI